MIMAAHVCLQSRNRLASVERVTRRRVVLDQFVEPPFVLGARDYEREHLDI